MMTEEIVSPFSQASFTPVPFKKTESQALEQKISASSSKGAEIEIFTKEGDKVTLSFNSTSNLQYSNTENLTYNSSGLLNQNQASKSNESLTYQKNEQFAFSSQSELTISIEGDLSDAEKKDIHKAIQAMEHVMNGFFNQSTLKTDNLTNQFSQLGTLSGLEASFSYEKSLSVIEKYEKASQTVFAPQVEYDEDDLEDDEHLFAPNSVEALVSKLAEQIESTNIDPEHFDAPLGGLFEHFEKKIEDSSFIKDQEKALEVLSNIQSELKEKVEDLSNLFGGGGIED